MTSPATLALLSELYRSTMTLPETPVTEQAPAPAVTPDYSPPAPAEQAVTVAPALLEVTVDYNGNTFTVYAATREDGERIIREHIEKIAPTPPATE